MYKKNQILVLLSLLTFISCTDSSEVFTIGNKFIDDHSKITYVDTLTVEVSTIVIDSFRTSGSSTGNYNTVFFGYNDDPILGKTYAESYLSFEHDDFPTIDYRSTFDSLVIFVKQNGSYFGDTTTVKKFSVYQLTELMEFKDDASWFYNIDTFAREDKPLATASFIPYPKYNESFYLRLPDSIGQQWFDSIQDNRDYIKSDSNFLSVFKGIVFVPETTDESWATSFNSYTEDSTRVEMRLYYTRHDEEGALYVPFIPRSGYSFTHFSIDRTGTISSVLDGEGTKIPSSSTDNKAFMQAGSGIGIKIEIPLIEHMNEYYPNITVLDAKLIMRPSKGTYTLTSLLPSKLSVLWTDKVNRNLGEFYDIDGETIITGTKQIDGLVDEPYYSFSILNFVLTKMATETTNYNTLMFFLPDKNNATSFDKLIIDDQSASNNSFELQLYYYTY